MWRDPAKRQAFARSKVASLNIQHSCKTDNATDEKSKSSQQQKEKPLVEQPAKVEQQNVQNLVSKATKRRSHLHPGKEKK